MQQETAEFQHEKAELEAKQKEISDIKQKLEALHLQARQLEAMEHKDELALPKLNSDIRQRENDLRKLHEEFTRAQQAATESIRQAGIKGGHFLG